MAHKWTEAEWPTLLKLVVLTHIVFQKTRKTDTVGLASLLAEHRKLEDNLGISEKGRRDLRWVLPSEAPELAEVRHLSVVPSPKRRVKAVDS
jgi:hypothetical protein